MNDLSYSISDVSALFGVAAVIVGIILALSQLRQGNHVRMMELTMQLYGRFGEEDFQHYYWRVHQWKFQNYQDFKDHASEEDWQAFQSVGTLYESLGLLLKRGIAKIDLLDDMMSGQVILTWEKMMPIIEGHRDETGKPQTFEWFELLYRRMVERLTKLAAEGKPTAGL